MSMLRKLVHILREDKRPLRRLASLVLIRLPFDAARFIRIRVRDYQIYLHRTTLAAEFWYNSNTRGGDYDFLRAYLDPADVYIDVGANIGTTVIPAATKVTHGRVIAFEPHPRIFSFLQENLRLNGITHVDARNCAVGAEPGWIGFTDKLTDDQNHPTDQQHSLKVPVEILDQVTRDIDRIALIKLDVEGYEKHVVDGGSQTLKKTGCVYFELCEDHARRFGYTSAELLAALEEHGFHLFRKVRTDQLAPVRPDYRQTAHLENAFAIRDVDAFIGRTGWRIAA